MKIYIKEERKLPVIEVGDIVISILYKAYLVTETNKNYTEFPIALADLQTGISKNEYTNIEDLNSRKAIAGDEKIIAVVKGDNIHLTIDKVVGWEVKQWD